MTLKNGTGQACAACKHQRRRCTPECLLAPFFPADQPKVFQSVHRLFGVKHVQNLLKELAPHDKVMAIQSIKFHAAMREKYPIYGCLVEIQHLTYQIQVAKEELQLVLQQLASYRQQQQQHHLLRQGQEEMPRDDCLSQQVHLGGPPGNGGMSIVHHDNPQNVVTTAVVAEHEFYSNNENTDYNSLNYNKENNDVDSLFIQQTCSYNNINNIEQSQLSTSQTMPIPQEEMHPFFDNIDDTQSYIGSKEVYESSLESPLKDSKHCTEQMVENELKSAAACFSLTSVN